MGKFRFKLSDMMPNAWFYKLKDMSKTKNHPTKKNFSKLQKSKLYEQNQAYFYYTIETTYKEKHYNSPKNPKISDTQFSEPSRNSSKKARRKAIYRPSPRHNITTSYSASNESEQIHARNHSDSSTESSTELDLVKSSSSEFESDTLEGLNGLDSWSSSCNCRMSSSTAHIIIDVNEKQLKGKLEKFGNFCESSELNLPPIQTRLPNSYDTTEFATFKYNNSSSEMEDIMKIINLESVKIKKEKSATPSLPRKSTGVKVGTKSPKLVSKKLQTKTRKSIPLKKISRTQQKTFSESFAIVKSSVNPQKDFRDSMMEMIVENNITTSKELEDLLACFLSLNSVEYHDVIIKAFEQIWFNMS
ncbi:hypothetical protein LIER_07914 [Lithospermum erythrorhizon]|uniref:Transcription repressor n=1 Tax=Lithospermum erythrorhizon TaxID=34254 RepID=A0AAV3PAQ2_LITER